jgi:AcrR family transcriptional regulator
MGKTQGDTQKGGILNTVQKSLLEKGLEKVKMSNITAKACINKINLCRYFPHHEDIAQEIHARMMNKIASLVHVLLFPFALLLAITAYTGIKLYKKTGNICLGGIVNELLITMITVTITRFRIWHSSVI